MWLPSGSYNPKNLQYKEPIAQSLELENPLERNTCTPILHSSTNRNFRRYWSMGSQRTEHDWETSIYFHKDYFLQRFYWTMFTILSTYLLYLPDSIYNSIFKNFNFLNKRTVLSAPFIVFQELKSFPSKRIQRLK